MTISNSTDRRSAQRGTNVSSLAMGCVGFIASCGLAPAAVAQDQAGEPTRLQGVTVTDTAVQDEYKAEALQSPKATAPLLDTPRTVSVITNSVLQTTASFSVADALRTVPGITLGAGEGGTASADIPLIRGIDATSDTYVDGARDIGSQTRETFAVERIEVFKGSNSAFGGRGSAGGAINIVSKLPQNDNFAIGQFTAGTDDFKRITADVNRKLGENLAFRINALWHDADVAGRDAVFDKRWGVAPSLTWGIGTDTQGTLSYYHYETDALPDYGIPLTSRGQLDATNINFRRAADVDYDNFYGLKDRDFQKTKVDSASFLFNHDFGGGWILSNTMRWSHSRNNYVVTNPDDSRGNVANGLVWRNTKSRNSTNDSLVNNLNLAGMFNTGSIEHSFAAGMEISTSKTSNTPYVVSTGSGSCSAADIAAYFCTSLANPDPNDPWTGTVTKGSFTNRTTSDEAAFYAFDTITIIPQLLLNGGVRWNRYTVHANGYRSNNTINYNERVRSTDWSWQGGVVFKPRENASLYFSWANSSTPPGSDAGEGTFGLTDTTGNYAPAKTENWEIGGKIDLFGGALGLTAALFQLDRSNIRDVDPNTGAQAIIANKARIKGVEVGASGTVGPVSLFAGYTYADSELRDGTTDEGNALPNAPKHNVAATASVKVSNALSIGGGAYHSSKRYADNANLISAPGYWRFDANAAYQISDHFDLRLNVQNLGDKRYIIKLRNPHFAVPAAGRQALVTLTATY